MHLEGHRAKTALAGMEIVKVAALSSYDKWVD